jgi:hypothetical protein
MVEVSPSLVVEAMRLPFSLVHMEASHVTLSALSATILLPHNRHSSWY